MRDYAGETLWDPDNKLEYQSGMKLFFAKAEKEHVITSTYWTSNIMYLVSLRRNCGADF
jgi:hypothetical protein